MLAIETEGLTKGFGRRVAVSDLSLHVPMNCVFGFLGPNGAGKTTTMRLLLGLLRPDAGRVVLAGHDMATQRLAALAQVGAYVESPSLYDHLSGDANLDLTRRLLGLPATEIDRVLELVDMRHAAMDRVRTYSLGMKQRLALARALLGTPRLLLLDEPTNGLDPDGIIAMRTLIRALPDRIGGTVFVSSHLLAEIEQVADHVGVMQAGRLIVQDEVRVLLGGDASIVIQVDDPDRGAALLRDGGHDATVMEKAVCLRAELPAQIAAANRLLVDAGLHVYAIVPRVRSLEDVYRDSVERAAA